MRRLTKILFPISVVLFMCSIAIGLLGRAFCTRSNDDYKSIQPESFVPDTIETVLYDKDLKQLYVCYNDANCVNVYTEEGKSSKKEDSNGFVSMAVDNEIYLVDYNTQL